MYKISALNEKKWKYLSIALMGIIATGVLAPRAFAANPTLESVLAVVTGIEAKTDNLPADPASTTDVESARDAIGVGQSIVINVQTTVPAFDSDSFTVLEEQAGKTYSGHITLVRFGATSINVYAQCLNADGGTTIIDQITGTEDSYINADFVCEKLLLQAVNTGPIPILDLRGSIRYVETNFTEVTSFP